MLVLRCLSVLVALSCLIPSPAAQTMVPPGNVSGHWTLAGSPYEVQGNLSIIGLTIDPGVVVQIDGDYLLDVRSQLNATGTAGAPILFTSATNDWNGLRFFGTPANTRLSHCIIENTDEPAIDINDSLPVITDCEVRNCHTEVPGPALNAFVGVGDLVLKGCTFRDNSATTDGGGLLINMGGGYSCVLQGCLVENNACNPTMAGVRNRSGAGILFEAEDGSLVLTETRVIGNRAYTITGCGGFAQCWGGGPLRGREHRHDPEQRVLWQRAPHHRQQYVRD